jgi:hypothetical protein
VAGRREPTDTIRGHRVRWRNGSQRTRAQSHAGDRPRRRLPHRRRAAGSRARRSRAVEPARGRTPPRRRHPRVPRDRVRSLRGAPQDSRAELAGRERPRHRIRARRERSRPCLKRYVHPDIRPKGKKWKKWYEQQRDRIAFIDSTGFWWQESPVVLEREAARQRRSADRPGR